MEHTFTNEIYKILEFHFKEDFKEVFDKSILLQYINFKTKSANKGAKARSSFANLYALYVVIEDYINKGFYQTDDYSQYEGVSFTTLFQRQRQLPFGKKLQNHALNNRLNSEFQKFFPTTELIPILRDLENNKYWINEKLLKININNQFVDISKTIISIIDKYIYLKKILFENFLNYCENLKQLESKNEGELIKFIESLVASNSDARIFEIVSYSILKYFYYDQEIYWGFDLKKLIKEKIKLYKTGRTNANDGGIDFVMKPIGRFFQVTETLNIKKYFLDIDKIEHFPLSFVIKSDLPIEDLMILFRENAKTWFSIGSIVDRYMKCIEEIINIPALLNRFNHAIKAGYLNNIIDEIIIQSKIEFNYE